MTRRLRRFRRLGHLRRRRALASSAGAAVTVQLTLAPSSAAVTLPSPRAEFVELG